MTLDVFRAHSLDGAALFFQPSTGVHLRLENDATRGLRQAAPRVVMFGITNACNLRCSYCSRDAARSSAWTVASAVGVLVGLSLAGTLEVAFGGGEPFAFRGFDELLTEIRRQTPLALHVTTNGALLDDALLARLSGLLGEVRLSLHEGSGWRGAARRLMHAGQRWGANVLVSPRALHELPARLAELAALGAHDVALLSYVGPDAGLHLDAADDARLAAVIRASPIPCRLSVCFGRRLDGLGVPRLFEAGCAAGSDLVTLTPDRRLQSCSFQDSSASVTTADEVLDVWRTRRAWLAERSPRAGCGRDGKPSPSSGGLRIWRAFSGNNSGECILVAKFARAADAQRLLADLAPGFEPGEPYGPAWQALFARERVAGMGGAGTMPDEIEVLGRTFVALTETALADEFTELRALAWTRSTFVVPGGFSGGFAPVLAVIRARDHADAEDLATRARDDGATAITHGAHAILAVTTLAPRARPNEHGVLAARFAWLTALAEGRPIACELVLGPASARALAVAAKTLGHVPARRARLVAAVNCIAPETAANAARFADDMDGSAHAGGLVLVEDIVRTKRPAVRALRLGASVQTLDVDEVEVAAELWSPRVPRKGRPPPGPPELMPTTLAEALRTRLRRTLGDVPLAPIRCRESHGTLFVRMRTTMPADVLAAIVAEAKAAKRETRLGVQDPDPLGRALRRLLADLRSAER